MLLNEVNNTCDIPFLLDIMQGEINPIKIAVAIEELNLTNNTAQFLVKDSIDGVMIYDLTTENLGLVITGQTITMNFANTDIIGSFVCQFTFTDTITGITNKSQIGKFIIKQSLDAII